jgi:uncharacterized protein
MTEPDRIKSFLDGAPLAVVGASRDRAKYGNKVLRALVRDGRDVFPVNPTIEDVEGRKSYPDLRSLPVPVHGVCVITPPSVTESIVEQAGRLGIKNIWLQPGAESDWAVERATQLGMNVISGGPCVLVELGCQ